MEHFRIEKILPSPSSFIAPNNNQKSIDATINEIVNTNAGSELLLKYQTTLQEMRQASEESARLANLCSTRMGRSQQMCKERADAVLEIDNFLRDTSEFDKTIRDINKQVDKLVRFCQQTEQALTHLEALDKIVQTEDEVELIRQQIFMAASSDARVCCCCGVRPKASNCKKCTAEKLGLYARKENIRLKVAEKQRLATQLAELFFHYQVQKAEPFVDLKSRKLELENLIANCRQRIDSKKRELKDINRGYQQSYKYASELREYIKKHQKYLSALRLEHANKLARLQQYQAKLVTVRQSLIKPICAIFPFREFNISIENNRAANNGRMPWMVVDDPVDPGIRYQMGAAYISDSACLQLGAALESSALCLDPEFRPAFAAFLFAIQLTQLIAMVFDFRFVQEFSFRHSSLREKWTRSIFENEWWNLCDTVILLCLAIGLPPSRLVSEKPHSNLIELGRFVLDSKAAKLQTILNATTLERYRELRSIKPHHEEPEDEGYVIINDA
ncbi:hypothetical protein WR25_01222 [Diploscapter pachys]|uniref:Uncharacterized protein n=1 Tax=Diploscapter pachys TaxID=2018661 RepID=A0A2A2KPL1_9BILA|nr:hypothetical protein WR25_01222 [Diploscapter pachys]